MEESKQPLIRYTIIINQHKENEEFGKEILRVVINKEEITINQVVKIIDFIGKVK